MADFKTRAAELAELFVVERPGDWIEFGVPDGGRFAVQSRIIKAARATIAGIIEAAMEEAARPEAPAPICGYRKRGYTQVCALPPGHKGRHDPEATSDLPAGLGGKGIASGVAIPGQTFTPPAPGATGVAMAPLWETLTRLGNEIRLSSDSERTAKLGHDVLQLAVQVHQDHLRQFDRGVAVGRTEALAEAAKMLRGHALDRRDHADEKQREAEALYAQREELDLAAVRVEALMKAGG